MSADRCCWLTLEINCETCLEIAKLLNLSCVLRISYAKLIFFYFSVYL